MDRSDHGHLKQLLVDSLPDCALVVLDPEGNVLSWNVGAEELLGYTEVETIGRSFSGLAGSPADAFNERRVGFGPIPAFTQRLARLVEQGLLLLGFPGGAVSGHGHVDASAQQGG